MKSLDFEIDRQVVYQEKEEGVVTSVNDTYVFVRYGSDIHSKATDPKDIRYLSES